MYPYTHVSMKGRTETQDPILAMILGKGRTDTQNPILAKREEQKPNTHVPIYPCKYEGKNRNPRPYISKKGGTETQYPCTHIPM